VRKGATEMGKLEEVKYMQMQLGIPDDRVPVIENEVEGAVEFFKNLEEQVNHLFKIQQLGEQERYFAVYLLYEKALKHQANVIDSFRVLTGSLEAKLSELNDQLRKLKQAQEAIDTMSEGGE